MTSGPLPIPAEIHRRRGTEGHNHRITKSPQVKIKGQVEPPEPPQTLDDPGKALWTSVWRTAYVWLSPDTDTPTMVVLCELRDLHAILREEAKANPSDYRVQNSFARVNDLLLKYLNALALNPTSRARLNVAEVDVEDELEMFRRERGAV